MIAQFVNAIAVIIGGLIGTVFGNRISEKYTNAIMTAIALITMIIGVQSAVVTSNVLIVVICLIAGTILGTALRIDDRLNNAGDAAKKLLQNTRIGKGPFSEALVTASMLFCVGSMTILGSIQAGLNHNYQIILTKSVMDFVSALAFSAALGAGVIFAFIPVLVIQGGITLLAGVVAPYLTAEVVTEMSAVGGALFIGMSINILGLRQEKIKVGDMLPAIFMPVLYFPIANFISSLI